MLTTLDPSAPCLSLRCLGEDTSVHTQAAYTDQMGHVTNHRVNGGLPERLVLPHQSHSMGTNGWLSHRSLQVVQVDLTTSLPLTLSGESELVEKKMQILCPPATVKH